MASIAPLLTDQAVDQLVDMLTRLPDPDTTLREADVTRADLRRLEGDDEIAAATETRREAVVSTPWRLEPWEENNPDPVAAWVWDELDPHLPGLIRDIWQAVLYGYSVVEVVYRRADGGRLGISHAWAKPIEWFEPRRDGALIWHGPQGQEETVDTAEKFLLTRRLPSYRQPYGEALLSRLYWPWFFRVNGWQFWARFLERHGAPLLIGKSMDTSAMLSALQHAVQSAVVSVDREDDVSTVASANAGQAFESFSAAVDRRVQKVILGQTLTTDVSGTGGSYAAAKVHNEVRDDRRLADCALVANTVQRLINALYRRNFPAADPPTFVFADQAGIEPERAERDATLVPVMQASGVRLSREYFLSVYDYEDDHIEDAPAPSMPPASAGLSAPTGQGVHLAANGQRFSADQELVEGLVDATLAEAASPIPADVVAKAVRNAKDPDDLVERLAKLYTGNDAAEFRELVERAMFSADVLGFVTAERRIGADEVA